MDTSYLRLAIGEEMLMRLELMTLVPNVILDLSRERSNEEILRRRFNTAEIIAVNADNEKEVSLLPSHSVDLIFSNLTLPWCDDFTKDFAEWQRVLRPNGLLMLSSLGPDTFIELKDRENILLNLQDMHIIGDQLIQTKFAYPVIDVDYLTVTYRNPNTLLQELQSMRMLNETLIETNIEPNSEGVFSVTYEIVYAHAWAKELKESSEHAGEIRIPLAHLRRPRNS